MPLPECDEVAIPLGNRVLSVGGDPVDVAGDAVLLRVAVEADDVPKAVLRHLVEALEAGGDDLVRQDENIVGRETANLVEGFG